MRTLTPAQQAALAQNSLFARRFFSVWVKHRTTGATLRVGFWDGLDDVTYPTFNPATAASEDRSYTAMGSLIAVDELTYASALTIRQTRIVLGRLGGAFDAVRVYTAEQQRCEQHVGLFSLDGGELTAPLMLADIGIVDRVEVERGATDPSKNESDASSIVLTVSSQMEELTRTSHLRRSDEHQRLVDANDAGRQHAANVGDWTFAWAQRKEPIPTSTVTQQDETRYV